jgi:hypothetical protein
MHFIYFFNLNMAGISIFIATNNSSLTLNNASMNRKILTFFSLSIVGFAVFFSKGVAGQVGVNYFFPEHGTFSIPLAPLSYSQPITFGDFRYFKLIPGGSVYNIGGMSVTGIPGEYPQNRSLIGPFYSILLSVMPAISIPIGMVDLDFCGGYWGAYNIVPGVKQGNMDKMFMNYEGWDACTSDMSFKNRINHGYVVGMSISIWFNDDQAVSPGVFYYVGGSKMGLNGTYTGGKLGNPVETKAVDFPNSRLNYRGFEVQIAVQL